MRNIINGKAFSIQNKALTVTFSGFLKTTPTFALEKQTHLQQKQTCYILMLPVAGAVHVWAAGDKSVLQNSTLL